MVTRVKLFTAHDLELLPEDGFRYELIRGELIRMPPPRGKHGIRQVRIAHIFVRFADEAGGLVTGQSGFTLEIDPDTVLAPDVSYTGPGRHSAEQFEETYPRLAPDVVVEINSRSNTPAERRKKLDAYHAAGTRLVLFVDDTTRQITGEYADGSSKVWRIGAIFDGGEIMPGFRIPVAEFFR